MIDPVACFALDPGPVQSALVVLDHAGPVESLIAPNGELLNRLGETWWRNREGALCRALDEVNAPVLVVEMIASYGMAVGAEVFETCVWIGRFLQRWPATSDRIYRRDVKLHLCGQARAKDLNIRQALLDRFGGKDTAVGRKAAPGPLYGLRADMWAALAVGLTWCDKERARRGTVAA